MGGPIGQTATHTSSLRPPRAGAHYRFQTEGGGGPEPEGAGAAGGRREQKARPEELPFLDFVDLVGEFPLDVPTLREVPREAQSQLAALTQGVCDALLETGRATAGEERAGKLLLLLHRLTLWAPRGKQAGGRRGPHGRATQQPRIVRDRIAAAWRGGYISIYVVV